VISEELCGDQRRSGVKNGTGAAGIDARERPNLAHTDNPRKERRIWQHVDWGAQDVKETPAYMEGRRLRVIRFADSSGCISLEHPGSVEK
jgi:hypothetical protein